MKWLFFLFSMNLFLTYYPVELDSCDTVIQIKYDDSIRALELFNVEVNDQSRVCEILENANTIDIAFEPNIQQDDVLSAWVFVDKQLLQQMLVDEEVATIVRKNPTYQYQLHLKMEMVSVPLYDPIEVNQIRGIWIVILHLIISVLVIVMARCAKY